MTEKNASPNRDEEPGNAAEDTDLSPFRALVVSGQASTRDLLIQVLDEFGVGETIGVADTTEALAVLRSREIHLLVPDLSAHRLEEADLVRNALALVPGLPIIVVSGHATIEWGVELMKAGVRDVVRKPLDVPVFQEKVVRLLDKSIPQEEDMPDQLGPYRIIEEVERGGMGIIYRATNETGKVIALKVLPVTAQDSMNQILRFHREAEAIGLLNHPNIVRLEDSGFAGKRYYIAMEFIDGPALDILAYETGLHFTRLVPIVVRILDAVQYAHDQDVLHRDLKPSNILMDRRDRPHIIDFGLAQYIKDDVRLTQTGVVMGTIGYIAPERIRGGMATPSCDVYSVGAILYECLTRKIPYETESQVITLPTTYEQLVPLRDLLPDIPSQLEAIVFRALAVQPSQRYGTAREFQRDLEHFLEGI